MQISVNNLQTSEIWVVKTVPWPLKRSQPAVKYRKKDQRDKKKKIQYSKGIGRFFGQKKMK